MAAGPGRTPGSSAYVNDFMMTQYDQDGGYYDGDVWHGFYYAYADLDQNGTDELLISYGSESKTLVDIYEIKNNQPHKLFADSSLGERTTVYLYPMAV